ncbi:MAG: hypothetical protein JNK85_02455 [Verrucomicrobiales bacterium]|nr:hypothetical protein [Verrucomicrobiales bacterium]
MNELSVLRHAVRRTGSRRRLELGLLGLWNGLAVGTLIWLGVVALHKIAPIPPEWPEFGWVLCLFGAAAGFAWGARHPVPDLLAARLLESRQPLQQRLSTALQIADRSPQHAWVPLLVADASRSLQGFDLARVLPLRLPRVARLLPLALAAVIGLGFVPEYRSANYLRAQREAALVRDAGKKMAELIRREVQRREPFQEPIRDALNTTAALAERLSEATLTKADALQDLASAAKRLEEEARQLEADPSLRRLQQAARSPSPAGSQSGAHSALKKQLEKLQQNPAAASPEALEKLAEQLSKAQKLAAAAQGANPSADAQKSLADALQQLAQNSSQLGANLGGLSEALEAMKNLDFDRVLKDLNMAGADLEKLRDMAQKMADMQQSMAELGKDLAEQLDRGQAEAAAQTLERMAKQLADASLTADQQRQVMEEVSKALQPAGDYGKVADLLKQAGENMAGKSNAQASQQLADAASELRKLAQQAQDAQQLAEMLNALKDAQLALASGKLWQPGGMCRGGACSGCAQHPGNRISWGKGGRPGQGVGTWADENDWLYYPEISERWDNSGIQRPDMAARGHTDRGEGQLSANALPTKLRGQFNPGPMPSITLKGVSIKGESTVGYQQAVDAAQSAAQSALNQDQVPRAYRNAVKGYFDDLK